MEKKCKKTEKTSVKQENKIIIITGPGGVGKTTISQFLCNNLHGKFKETVSCTTRAKRECEIDGKDYYFITDEEFQKKVENNEFIEHNLFPNGFRYGTLYSEAEGILKNCNCIIVMDPVTAAHLRENPYFGDNTITFFLDADEDTIHKRLVKRGAKWAEIKKRMSIAEKEREYADSCDHHVFVRNPYDASRKIYKIVTNGEKFEL